MAARGSERIATALAGAALLALGSSCANPKTEPAPPLGRADASYSALYPHHVDVCALSQIRPLAAPSGGSAGHAVMYLSGACRRADAAIPLLETCDPPAGTGVSVNKMFKNVNWVAIPGRELFFEGDLIRGERLTREHFEATVRRAMDLGIFRGIEVHRGQLDSAPPAGDLGPELIARESIGTDYALAFGRSIFCAKLPITRAMMAEIVDYLNELNLAYAAGEVDYEWSGYHDNCTHTIRNALANADVWTPTAINAVKLRQVFNLAVPANEFINLGKLGNDGALERPRALHRDRVTRESLIRFGWLPTRHGVLLETIPVHADNDLYDAGFRILVLENPFFRSKTAEARRMLRDPSYREIEVNLQRFRERYAAILAGRPHLRRPAEPGSYDDYARRYYAYIERQLADVEAKLAEPVFSSRDVPVR